jgi:hypothetical protein
LIDVDPERYSVSLLREWKRIAEARPLLSVQGNARNLYELARHERMVQGVGREGASRAVHRWALDIGLEKTWGSTIAQACEALFAEIIFNIFDHSIDVPAYIKLGSRQRVLTLSYEGALFGLDEWESAPSRGGGSVVLSLVKRMSQSVLINHTYREGVNRWYIAYKQKPGDGCGLHLAARPSEAELERISSCSIVWLYAGGTTFTLSDPMRVLLLVKDRGVRRVNVVDISKTHFLAPRLSEYANNIGVELQFLEVPPARQ